MHMTQAAHPSLQRQCIVAELALPGDAALPLRLLSLLHRRGVFVNELHLEEYGSADDQYAATTPRLVAIFDATNQQARVIQAGFQTTIGVVRTHLGKEATTRAS
jgi:hypothetical protein